MLILLLANLSLHHYCIHNSDSVFSPLQVIIIFAICIQSPSNSFVFADLDEISSKFKLYLEQRFQSVKPPPKPPADPKPKQEPKGNSKEASKKKRESKTKETKEIPAATTILVKNYHKLWLQAIHGKLITTSTTAANGSTEMKGKVLLCCCNMCDIHSLLN